MMSKNIIACTSSLTTELTLGLPGESSLQSSCTKPKYSESIDLRLRMGSFNDESKSQVSCDDEAKTPPEEVVVGWPPLRENRKNTKMMMKSSKYIKVGVDGAPYLRKVNLGNYNSYDQLQNALENLFPNLNIRTGLDEKKIIDPANGVKYVQTYEDKDGDWMLVGDVPWEMFLASCKKVRLVKRSETIKQRFTSIIT
ncbi:hypothetical protein LIER_05302 [Lithospermum erythrorhizon]|uniref:Auxin-responsive protein n=1 Tax=Lithospermum erythrorhizon TaxID=34254 RepID=A0AAV3P1M8_LITER